MGRRRDGTVAYRAFLVPAVGIAAVLFSVLAFGDLQGNLVYYLTPSEAVERQVEFGGERRFRLAGQVVDDSVHARATGAEFSMSDGLTTIDVVHAGAPPQLFRPGIDVVVEGSWEGGRFASDTMMIKHDEEYCAPEREERHCPSRTPASSAGSADGPGR